MFIWLVWAEPRGLSWVSRTFLGSVHSGVFCWKIPGWDQGSIKVVTSRASRASCVSCVSCRVLAALAAVCERLSAAGATSRQSNQPEWLLLSGPKWAECDRWNTERPFSGRVKGQGPGHGAQMAQVTLVEERCGSTPPEGGGVRGSVNVQTGSCAAILLSCFLHNISGVAGVAVATCWLRRGPLRRVRRVQQ